MRHILFLFGLIIAFFGKAQFNPTDSLNFGEDSTTHGYTKFGNVTVGSYTCGSDKSIRVGNSTSADSIVFNLAVTPNTDSIKIELVMPWHGGVQLPKIWIENLRNDTVPYAGNGNCIPVFIKMGGLSSKTNDGFIKVKLMDTLPGFNMDGQFTYIKVYSKAVVGAGVDEKQKEGISFDVFPNPSSGLFYIKGNVGSKPIMVYNTIGILVHSEKNLANPFVDLSSLPTGIYLIRVGDETKRILKQ